MATGPSLSLEDLEKLKNENTISMNSMYEQYHRRIGIHPFIKELSFKEAVDINHPEDFALAEVLWNA